MIDITTPAIWLSLLFRVTIILAVGWMAVFALRSRHPQVTLLIQRLMMASVWLAAILVAFGPVITMAVLPQQKSHGEMEHIDSSATSAIRTSPSTVRESVDQSDSPIAIAAVGSQPQPAEATIGGASPIGPAKIHQAAGAANSGQPIPVISRQMDFSPQGLQRLDAASKLPATRTQRPNQLMMIALHSALTSWFVVTLILIVRLLVKTMRTWACIARSSPCLGDTIATSKEVASELGLRVVPEIRYSRAVSGPCTTGCWRSVVLLPQHWTESLSEPQKKMVLAHELSHVAGRDSFWDTLAQFTRAVWWFHPLVLILVGSHRLACEHRCDLWAAAVARDPKLYRRQLARWALQLNTQRTEELAALAMTSRSLMIRRLRWLQGIPSSPSISKRRAVVSVAIGLFGCALVATVHPTQHVQGAAQVDQGPIRSRQSPERDGDAKIEVEQRSEKVPARAGEEDKPVFLPIIWGVGPLAVDLNRAVDFKVRVLDSGGAPVKGASVMLGTITDDKGVTASLPMISGNLSNARGVATVPIPAGTQKVGLTTTAPGFAKGRHDFNTHGSPEIKLKRGRVVTVRAVDVDGMVLEDAFPILQNSRILGREFARQADGTHQSPVVDLDRRWMQVVANLPDRPLLFSGLVDVSNERLAGADGVIELGLRPGVLLEGRLDDSVPRPIKHGFVELMIVQGGDYRIERGGLQWQDTVAIRPDGSFSFVSVPPGGHAQLFAMGEGFQSTNPSAQQMRDYFAENDAGEDTVIADALGRPDILPQLVRLDREHVQVTLPCRETAGLDVRVIDPAGNPVSGATGSFNPNGYFLPGELFIPGTERSTRAMVASGANGILALAGLVGDSPARFVRRSFLQVESDDEGMIRFRNLPSRKDSYEIEADGLVMAPHPTSSASDPQRFALVNLNDGEIARQTITMERDVPRGVRELAIVYHDGTPLADTQWTVTELTTSDDQHSGDWQQWSVQRLGPVSEGKSDANGRILLSYPAVVDGQPVRSLRLHVRGQPEKNVSVRNYVTVPVKRDRRVIVVTPAESSPTPGVWRSATATYTTWAAAENLSRRDLAEQLLQQPSLVGLRRLLNRNEFDAAEPVTFKPERNWTNPDQKSAVVRVQTNEGERFVALAGVRPKRATWTERPGGGFPPEAAFVFDGDGKLVRMIGGGTSASGSEESITLANLGGTGDFFVRTSAFESHPPFEYYSRWYRIGGPPEPSLTVHHYANSNSWSGINGSSDPISEFGFLGYEFNGQDIDHKLPGVTPRGAVVPRRILWDGRRDSFVGPETQLFEGRSLYRVVDSESREFQSIDATADTIVAAGGRRDFRNWHQWTVTIPRRGRFVARLVIRDADGKTVERMAEQPLAAGQHNFQLQIAPEGQTESTSQLVTMFDASGVSDKTEFTIERMEIDNRESVTGQLVYVASESPLRLFDKRLADPMRSLLWVIEADDHAGE